MPLIDQCSLQYHKIECYEVDKYDRIKKVSLSPVHSFPSSTSSALTIATEVYLLCQLKQSLQNYGCCCFPRNIWLVDSLIAAWLHFIVTVICYYYYPYYYDDYYPRKLLFSKLGHLLDKDIAI